jgi:hypothetical protein
MKAVQAARGGYDMPPDFSSIVTEDDVRNWWTHFDENGASSTSTNNADVYLYGFMSDNSKGSVEEPEIEVRENQRVIFPLICSEDTDKLKADEDTDSQWEADMYARINGEDVKKYARKVAAQERQWHINGYWIGVRGLSKGTIVEFGGKGPRGFETGAKYTIG